MAEPRNLQELFRPQEAGERQPLRRSVPPALQRITKALSQDRLGGVEPLRDLLVDEAKWVPWRKPPLHREVRRDPEDHDPPGPEKKIEGTLRFMNHIGDNEQECSGNTHRQRDQA